MYTDQNKENTQYMQQVSALHKATTQPYSTRNQFNTQSATSNQHNIPCNHECCKEREISYINQIVDLKKTLAETYINYHNLEHAIEEYQVNTNRSEEQLTITKRKMHELQDKCTSSDQKIKSLSESIAQLEQDKKIISDKWMRLSSRLCNEGKHKQLTQEYKQSLGNAEEQNKKSNTKITELQSTISILRTQYKHQESQLKESQNTIMQMQVEQHKYIDEHKQLHEVLNRNRQLQAQIDICREENTQMIEDRLKQDNTANENNQQTAYEMQETQEKIKQLSEQNILLATENDTLREQLNELNRNCINQASQMDMIMKEMHSQCHNRSISYSKIAIKDDPVTHNKSNLSFATTKQRKNAILFPPKTANSKGQDTSLIRDGMVSFDLGNARLIKAKPHKSEMRMCFR